MTEKFTVTANNCHANSIKAEFTDVPKEKVEIVLHLLEKAFRQTEVINPETGEIAYSNYVGFDFFEQAESCGAMIDLVTEILKEEEEVIDPFISMMDKLIDKLIELDEI